ncbi:hypothetical protein PENTCL1PPCAC_15922, partial [Pristionchus entomophagus]
TKLDLPPERLPSDSIHQIFLLFVITVGVPTNLLTLRKLLVMHKLTRNGGFNATFILLKIHLTVSDLMLLIFYAAPQLLWNITYVWILGD